MEKEVVEEIQVCLSMLKMTMNKNNLYFGIAIDKTDYNKSEIAFINKTDYAKGEVTAFRVSLNELNK